MRSNDAIAAVNDGGADEDQSFFYLAVLGGAALTALHFDYLPDTRRAVAGI
ncbi:MAG: hypothetical protein WA789_09570 [Candidatus Acidiferrum sp.]